ncbi:MAG: branched-chain amino acid transport system permease protein [Solirubrobacterales bacterium]|nr:branched-chain amino acid transport system permease protein [Solirubrobacterales bacterium]
MTPKTDRRTLLMVGIAVPIIVLFATALLGMNLFMAIVLGLFLAARMLFPDDRRATVAVIVLAILWAVALPFVHDEGGEFMSIGTLILAYAVMALGLNIIVGYAGLLDLGYVAFFALGALTAGWFMSDFFSNAGKGGDGIHFGVSEQASGLFGIHFNFLIVVVIAIVVCTIAGMLIGLPTLRLRGDYIAIVTLAFGEIIGRIVINGDQLHFGDAPLVGGGLEKVFGEGAVFSAGREGITPIDKIYLPPLNGGEPFLSLNLRPWFLVALAMVLIVLFVNYRLRDSRLGRAWIALREDEVAAASMGVPLVRTKLLAYGTGAAFGGISGVFLASRLSVVNADQFQFFFSIFILAMVILGGLGSIEGVLIGAGVLVYLNFKFIPDVNEKPREWFDLDLDLSELSAGIYGFLLVIMMLLRPQGLIPERRRKMELVEHVGTGQTSGVGGPSDDTLYEARA